MQFIDLKAQYALIEPQVQQSIQTVLAHGRFIMGPEVHLLEEKLAQKFDAKYCVSVSSGTDALLVALMALGIQPGDEVITTPFTFIATAEVIRLLGAHPVFVDIKPDTYNINPDCIEAAVTSKTKAILPVDLFGQCADYDAIQAIADKHGLSVVADAAQSLGATYKGRKAGQLGTIACTSFYPSKPLGCYGDGGACFTDNEQLAETLRKLRNHGQSKRYTHQLLAVNARLDTLQAAILLQKLPIFDEEIALRQVVAERYASLLPEWVGLPHVAPDRLSVFAQYTVRVKQREALIDHLSQQGVPTAVHYPIPLHKQPVFEAYSGLVLPEADHAAAEVLSLPFHPYLNAADQEKVALALSSFTEARCVNAE